MSQPPPTGPTSGGWGTPGPSPYDGGAGGAVTGTPSTAGRGGGRRGALLIGGAVAAVAVVGGGVWGATAFFSTGEQPAAMLPADTVAYVAIDLDPSGSQKLEALQALQKFPILEDQLGEADGDTDVKKLFYDFVAERGGSCGYDYDRDLADWLGDRAGLGFLLDGDEPRAAGVLQITDPSAAEDGLQAMVECASASDGGRREYGYAIGDGWAVIGYDDEAAQDVLDSAAEASLADDDDYGRWVDAAGDPGVVTAYVSSRLGDFLGSDSLTAPPPGTESLIDAFDDFDGAALTLRFADEGLELQSAIGGAGGESLVGTDVTDVTDGLPADTAALVAADLEPGWAGTLLNRITESIGVDPDTVTDEIETETGISLPDDLERLLGQGAALVVSSGVDAEGVFDGSTPPDEAPIGVRAVTDDPDAAAEVLDRLQGSQPQDVPLGYETEGDLLAISPDPDFRSGLLEEGDLGSQDRFTDALPTLDRSGAVFYLDLDVVDDYSGLIDDLSGDPRVSDNIEPLAALGVSTWAEDDSTVTLLRLTTD